MIIILLLFDLQEILNAIEPGDFPGNSYINKYGITPSSLYVIEKSGVKTIHLSGKMSQKPGLELELSAVENLLAGDRITVTGRIGGGAPRSDWAIVIDRNTSEDGRGYVGLAQHITPEHEELYNISYLLSEDDLNAPLLIRSNNWGRADEIMDYYVDSVLITRDIKNMQIKVDERKEVYSFNKDKNVKTLKPGDITKYIRSAGTPKYTMTEKDGKRGLHLSRRMNNWDGLDVWLTNMNLIKGNNYRITVNGRVDGEAPDNAGIMLQMLPGYIWRSDMKVKDNQEFTLTHVLTEMEVQISESIRIATDDNGATMSFFIHDIEVEVIK